MGKARIQATTIDLDGDGTIEILIGATDDAASARFWVFSYSEVTNIIKINPFVQEFTEYAQYEVIISGSKIYTPIGSQGMFKEYLYTVDGMYQAVL